MKKVFLFFLIAILNVFAVDTPKIQVADIFNPHTATPSLMIEDTLKKPKDFNPTNELTRYVGSFYVATGELLYLKGRITDAFGIPIINAKVYIWQTNSAGKYHSVLKTTSLQYDENFIMSGTSKTDNLGIYGFKTVFPGFEEKERAPHINIIVQHDNFDTLITEIYFEDHYMNKSDPIYQSYTENDKKMLTARVTNVNKRNTADGKIATFDIVLDGIHGYKKY
ncbi:MAG: dioxygenase [Rickettsiales bacterium]|nr:MAG: dioxygenase [Rickettsiales bacterium]